MLAVCDVDEKRLKTAVTTCGAGVMPYRDYRYLLERKDIDAVVIATPDHWHAVQTVHACESGKHADYNVNHKEDWLQAILQDKTPRG